MAVKITADSILCAALDGLARSIKPGVVSRDAAILITVAVLQHLSEGHLTPALLWELALELEESR